DLLMKALELGVRGRTPARSAGARGLIDLQIRDRVLAQPVPVAIDEPGRAHHGAGLVAGPEPEHEAAPQLVALLLEHPAELHDAGVAGGVVGRLRAGPGVLVPADHDEIVALALDLADRDLHRTPAVLDVGAKPHSHRALLKHLAQLQARAARDADARQRWHLGLEGLGRRIPPHRLARADRHRRIAGMAPVHHHAAACTHQPGYALLLVARRMVGKFRERD